MSFDSGIAKGESISNDELIRRFKCSNQGGMRRSLRTNTLVLTSKPGGVYADRWEDDVLHYTGMGLESDQTVGHQNKTLAELAANGVDAFLFESFNSNAYLFHGPAGVRQW